MKQPLITIEGKDCSRCNSEGKIRIIETGTILDCGLCNGKTKSPTKLIFNAGDFERKGSEGIVANSSNVVGSSSMQGRNSTPHSSYSNYLLPKKGDRICAKCGRLLAGDKGLFHHKDTNQEDCLGFAKPFRLSSDAVLKSVGEFCKHPISATKTMLCKMDFEKHNLSESSKIVIAEGYYE